MSAIRVISQVLIARSGAWVFGRVYGWGAVPITQASIQSMTMQVWDLDYMVPTYGPTVLTVSQVVYNSLQVTPQWLEAGGDQIGFNVLVVAPAVALSMAGRRMRCDVKFVPVTGENFVMQAEANLSPTYVP